MTISNFLRFIPGLIYFANHLNERSYIEVMKNSTNETERLRTVLYSTETERPHQLAVDPINRYYYLRQKLLIDWILVLE